MNVDKASEWPFIDPQFFPNSGRNRSEMRPKRKNLQCVSMGFSSKPNVLMDFRLSPSVATPHPGFAGGQPHGLERT
jgi:hypothetical protein